MSRNPKRSQHFPQCLTDEYLIFEENLCLWDCEQRNYITDGINDDDNDDEDDEDEDDADHSIQR